MEQFLLPILLLAALGVLGWMAHPKKEPRLTNKAFRRLKGLEATLHLDPSLSGQES